MVDKMNLKRVLGLYGISAKMDLAWLLRDTKYAIAAVLSDLISNLATVSSVYLISVRFGGIGGMSSSEVLFMMAYSTMITGSFIMFGAQNNFHVSRIIGRGQLEHMFIQPVPVKVQLATMGFAPFTGGINFVVGAILLVIAGNRMDLHVTPQWFLMLFLFLLATMTTIIARAYLVSSVAFYSPVSAEEISTKAIEGTWLLSTFPLSGMPAFVQIPLLTILPDGLMAWFPSLCLLGRPPLGLGSYYPMLYAIILATVAAAIFKKGMNYYVKRGSNRYVPYGFRR